MAYLDANASEPLRPEARAAVLAALDAVGNPASVHRAGRAAGRLLEDSREAIAARFGAAPAGVVFTSGATEANAAAVAALGAGRRVLVGAGEHPSVLAAAPDAGRLPLTRAGAPDLDALANALASGGPALVCLMFANNETGCLLDLPAASGLCAAHGAQLFVDAAQAAGRITLDFAGSGAAAMSLSSHKLGGPPGAGAILLREGDGFAPLIAGGGQERGRRGGTPALSAIAGFAAAVAATPAAYPLLRDLLERGCVEAGGVVCGAGPRLPNTTCLALPGVDALLQVMTLDLAGHAVSAGAACSSGRVGRSHVLEAMGLGPLAAQAIRVSLPWNATEADVASFVADYAAMAARLSPSGAAKTISAA